MEKLQEFQKQILNDILINFYMNNPELYDKMEAGYIYTVDKIEKIKVLKNYLSELVINVSVSEIIKTWQSLVQKFKTCLTNEKKAGTGSGAVQHDFVY
ncbi:hypothetical protein TSAR_007338 [Trichomalopsis sarcophagae]|uniref:Uncharacterized protein n=1 Tax=Trichomalopsis sarcophagae TaxID=543379 RepID=A0A232EMY2_9HYME|nr:hypothetical protein TSAR_007338 [Trichomalopsis sarcophagae]